MPAENSAPRESEKLTTCAEMEVISAHRIRDASGVTASVPESESVVWENKKKSGLKNLSLYKSAESIRFLAFHPP